MADTHLKVGDPIPTGASFDTPSLKVGDAIPKEASVGDANFGHVTEDSPSMTSKLWNAIKALPEQVVDNMPGLGDAHKAAGAVRDWTAKKLDPANSKMLTPAQTFGYGALHDYADFMHGASSPEGLGIAAAGAVAPELVAPAMVAHGGYNLFQGWGDVAPRGTSVKGVLNSLNPFDRTNELNPDAVQGKANAAAEMVGGAALGGETIRSGGGPVTQAIKGKVPQLQANAAAQKIVDSAKDFFKSAPPSKSAPYEPADLNVFKAHTEEIHPTGKNNGATVESLRDAGDTAIEKIEDHISDLIGRETQEVKTIDGKKVTKMPGGIPNDVLPNDVWAQTKEALEKNASAVHPEEGIKAIDALKLKGLDNPEGVNIRDADAARKRLNAENRAVLTKNKYNLDTARETDPGFAAREAMSAALRDGIYKQLEDRGASGVRELRLEEGSIIKVRNALQNQLYNAEKTVADSAPVSRVRNFTAKTAKTGGLLTGGYIGHKVAGPVGEALGGLAGLEVGGAIADAVAPPNLTRNQLLERSYRTKTGGFKGFPKMNLQAIPEKAVPIGTQGALNPPVDLVPSQVPQGQPSLFGTSGTPPTPMEARLADLMKSDVHASHDLDVLRSPAGTRSQMEIAAAKQRLSFLTEPGGHTTALKDLLSRNNYSSLLTDLLKRGVQPIDRSQ